MKIPQELIGKYVVSKSGCWNWTGRNDGRPDGYGRVWVRVDGEWKTLGPHRMMLIEATGVDRVGMDSCHSCDNRRCINPAHLSWGTRKENYWDSRRKGRQPNVTKDHCKRGHPLSGGNLYVVPRKGERRCRECTRMRDRVSWKGLD